MAEAETEPTGFVFLKQTLIYYSQIIPKKGRLFGDRYPTARKDKG